MQVEVHGTDRVMAAVCQCCGAHAHEYPGEIFTICAACGRGIYIARAVTLEDHLTNAPRAAETSRRYPHAA